MRPTVVLACLLAALPLAGCGKKIGDPCSANVDCSAFGDRFCDVSAPDGYCTLEGCDVGTCPDEAVCVRFFQPLPDRPCNAEAVYPGGCRWSERCVQASSGVLGYCASAMGASSRWCAGDEHCAAGETCTSAPSGRLGFCAPESSERRWCQQPCDDNGDCRDGYRCAQTGFSGAEPVPTSTSNDTHVPVGPSAKFCVQTP